MRLQWHTWCLCCNNVFRAAAPPTPASGPMTQLILIAAPSHPEALGGAVNGPVSAVAETPKRDCVLSGQTLSVSSDLAGFREAAISNG
jgi:hypothetical protein